MRTDTFISIFDLIVFLGVFQGLLISWFFIRNGINENKANLIQGILILALSLTIFEELLNNTGYIVKVLAISNYSEPLNFSFAPLFYLFIKRSLNNKFSKKDWLHFIPSLFWLLYMIVYFIQTNEFKYNSYVESKHPNWPYLDVIMIIDDDPIGIRNYINEITGLHFLLYIPAAILLINKKLKTTRQSFFQVQDGYLKVLRNTILHFLALIVIFFTSKLTFENDVGDYFIATYISIMIFSTSIQILNKSTFFNQAQFFLEFPIHKYQKSSLNNENKESILNKIKAEFDSNQYFINNMASLADLAKRIHESSHHVSQVINEKMGMNFFELLASYRIKEAQKLIEGDNEAQITVEDLADRVGYNSKSSFNKAFKKITSQTPSEYRRSTNKS